jgi:hypothetical protein
VKKYLLQNKEGITKDQSIHKLAIDGNENDENA